MPSPVTLTTANKPSSILSGILVMTTPLITVDDIAVRLRDRWLLNGSSWRINTGEQWAVVGPNGAGKTTLAKAIAGRLPVVQGKIHYHAFGGLSPIDAIAYVASDSRRDFWRRERDLDHARGFAGRFNDATTVRGLICRRLAGLLPPSDMNIRLADIAERLNLEFLLDKPASAVSTGEMSRVLVALELIRRPMMLILDEPFEGLDRSGRQGLMGMFDRLAASGLPIMLITHRPEEMLSTTTHVLTIDRGRIAVAGAVDKPSFSFNTESAFACEKTNIRRTNRRSVDRQASRSFSSEPLIDMKAVTVRYGDTIVLDRFTWSVNDGEHWAVTGPNGAGKSTILKLITGDCLQVYANRIRLFGKDRGTAQTLWEIRERLGVVSHDLASGYQKRMSALDVVCSGFFDSVGLYRHCNAEQIKTARQRLAQMDLSALSQTPFNRLSQGQRQMILIARSMVKSPKLLILDEPCAGLDPENRRTVLSLLERIGHGGTTGLIVVSHHEKEIPACITHRLILDRGIVMRSGPLGTTDRQAWVLPPFSKPSV
ncbi:ATP-binding cassette domain-containing protein [uncultured Desulfosarcina sp.]|uniref:ATP-binding cassette domain-containing protein n=1 Tax=uncultured Desulfosarcina sp. TaxID=218289 RepID=UPI0029C717D5|nr:ATP-binding cassette domain-containing protein [uncultured Desulfosarcina sp.]